MGSCWFSLHFQFVVKSRIQVFITVKNKQVSRFISTGCCLKVEQLTLGCSKLKYTVNKLEFPFNHYILHIFCQVFIWQAYKESEFSFVFFPYLEYFEVFGLKELKAKLNE